MTLYEIKKNNDYKLFNEEYNRNGIEWLIDEGSCLFNKYSYLRFNKDGMYLVKEPNFSVPAIFMTLMDNSYKEYIFKNVIDISEKEKKRKVNRKSGEKKEDVEFKYLKMLIRNDVQFSLRYGYELYERDVESFFGISICFAMMAGWEKTLYVLALKRLMNMKLSKNAMDEMIFTAIKFLAGYTNRMESYEKLYRETDKNETVNIEAIETEIAEIEKREDFDYNKSIELIYLKGIRMYMKIYPNENSVIYYNMLKMIKDTAKYEFDIKKTAILV